MQHRLIERLAKAFDDRNIAYMLLDYHVNKAMQISWLTSGIDITVGISPQKLPFVIDVCEEVELTVEINSTDEYVLQTFVLPAVDTTSGAQLRFIFSESSYESVALQRAELVSFYDYDVRCASVEDCIIHKLIAQRQENNKHIAVLLRNNTDLDNSYIMQWLADFDEGLNTHYVHSYETLWADNTHFF